MVYCRQAPFFRPGRPTSGTKGALPMFEGLQRALGDALKKLRGRGRITEANIRDGLQEVRRALLDADVNYNVVNAFTARVTERAVGQSVLRSLDRREERVEVVYEDDVALLGRYDY